MRRACWWDQTPPICTVMLDDASSGAVRLNKRQHEKSCGKAYRPKGTWDENIKHCRVMWEITEALVVRISPCFVMNASITRRLVVLANGK
ncbi:uncharacterized [Tachysurus ichikawai]